MIRPLRSRHRVMFVAIAVIGSALLIAALTAYRPIPTVETIPAAVSGEERP